MRRIALVDYGSGNLRSAEKALQQAAAAQPRASTVTTTSSPEEIAAADLVVLPGVGAFAACMAALEARSGVVEAMSEAVRQRGAPFLGICVGLQLLAERGLEFGETGGLGWIKGDVRRIEPHEASRKVPHMGWNELTGALPEPLFAGLPPRTHMYFTHSFAIFPSDPADVAAETDHGGPIVAAVVRGNIAGVQFHPEKSQAAGARLLSNVLAWRP